MANTYTWDCKTVDVYPEYEDHADTVYNVHWRINAQSDQQDAEGNYYTSTAYGAQSLSLEGVGSDFIPFADLTNEIVSGWVEGIMGEEKVAKLKSSLDTNIDQQINPATETKTIGE